MPSLPVTVNSSPFEALLNAVDIWLADIPLFWVDTFASFARLTHCTRSLSMCVRLFAEVDSWRESSCVGASTSARGSTAYLPFGGDAMDSVFFSAWISGTK